VRRRRRELLLVARVIAGRVDRARFVRPAVVPACGEKGAVGWRLRLRPRRAVWLLAGTREDKFMACGRRVPRAE
jgi:hypothetical protein